MRLDKKVDSEFLNTLKVNNLNSDFTYKHLINKEFNGNFIKSKDIFNARNGM